MILADKIITLRKKAGWSQEELAQKLDVSRQSVSKWEGAQSVPDIEKILQISKLFGVTTDYLLKDEMGEPEYAESELTALRRVTLEQANAALAQAKVNAPYMAWGTALCVASPVMLLLLGEICQHSQFGLNEKVATGIGLCVLLVMVCVAVVLFMLCGTKNRDFDFLEKELLSFYKYPLMQYVLTIILSLVWISLKGIFISVWYKVWYSSYKKCGTAPACKNK